MACLCSWGETSTARGVSERSADTVRTPAGKGERQRLDSSGARGRDLRASCTCARTHAREGVCDHLHSRPPHGARKADPHRDSIGEAHVRITRDSGESRRPDHGVVPFVGDRGTERPRLVVDRCIPQTRPCAGVETPPCGQEHIQIIGLDRFPRLDGDPRGPDMVGPPAVHGGRHGVRVARMGCRPPAIRKSVRRTRHESRGEPVDI